MTLADLIQIAADEGSDPADLVLILPVGGQAFELTTAEEQDDFNPHLLVMTLTPYDPDAETAR